MYVCHGLSVARAADALSNAQTSSELFGAIF